MPNFRDNEGRDDKSDEGAERSNDICRDFLRNNCSRGNRCRYRHPSDVDNGNNSRQGGEVEFCHDYQNAGCRRPNCRFMHCTREEEEHYRRTGQLPSGPGGPMRGKGRYDDMPICKDFLKGECRRAGRCKYRHLTQGQYEMEEAQKERMMMMQERNFIDRPFPSGPMSRLGYDDDLDFISAKRRCLDGPPFMGSDRRMLSSEEVQMLQDENAMLRQKVDQLRKQVSDLTATNETLLEQNARFRSGQVVLRASAGPVLAPGASANSNNNEMMSQRPAMGGYGEPSAQPLLGSSQLGAPSVGAYGSGQRNPVMVGGPGLVSYPIMSHSSQLQNSRMG